MEVFWKGVRVGVKVALEVGIFEGLQTMGLRLLLGRGLSVRFWKGVGVEALERWKVEKVFFFG